MLECGNAMLKNGYKVRILNTINFKKSIRPMGDIGRLDKIRCLISCHSGVNMNFKILLILRREPQYVVWI